MFTGIIEDMGRVSSVAQLASALALTIQTEFGAVSIGESIAVNGVCLTVIDQPSPSEISFFVSSETLQRSNLKDIPVGCYLNLERSASLTSRLSGHLVQGHVDGTGILCLIAEDGAARRVSISLPKSVYPYCVTKGSIALNGISMTINEVSPMRSDGRFEIGITVIPHTWNCTNLQFCKPGVPINVEVDILAKYVERLCQPYLKH